LLRRRKHTARCLAERGHHAAAADRLSLPAVTSARLLCQVEISRLISVYPTKESFRGQNEAELTVDWTPGKLPCEAGLEDAWPPRSAN